MPAASSVTVGAAATVGAALATVTAAVPSRPPAAARSVATPGVGPAVNRPVGSTAPTPPSSVHANVGCVSSGSPNWSKASAANCWLPFSFTVNEGGC